MPVHRLNGVDAFVVVDLHEPPVATGPVRRGEKILASSATELARTITYAYAALGMRRSGASAGVNAPDDAADAALEGFQSAAAALVASGAFLPDPGKGVDEAVLAPLRAGDPRHPALFGPAGGLLTAELDALSAVVAAEAALGALDGRRVAIEGFGDAAVPLVRQLADRGARIESIATAKGTITLDGSGAAELVEGWKAHGPAVVEHLGTDSRTPVAVLGAEVDVLFAGSKLGVIGDKASQFVRAGTVVPTGPMPVTAKAFADLGKLGTVVLPDFVVAAGRLHAAWADHATPIDGLARGASEAVAGLVREVAGAEGGVWLASCRRAEAFLSAWQPKLPFGRPLAS
jgi:hypothetical protein